jgi:regulator of sirC expression with transglutaminase-like and TPR domain
MPTSPPFAGDFEFQKLLAGDRDDVDLVGLMLEFAGDAYPRLDRARVMAELDRLGRAASKRLACASRPSERAKLVVLSELLFAEEGFRGDRDAYYDPRNSYLNEVLDRRLGIPISLAIVYQAVAARAGVRLFGVGTPGHFLLGSADSQPTLYVDPFSGDVLDREACRLRIETLLGESGVIADEHFRPAAPLEIGLRVLRNLKAAYVMENQWLAVLPVQQRLAMLSPDKLDERRDLGLIYLRTGQAPRALRLLEEYSRLCDPSQAEELRPYLHKARRMMAELN